MWVGKPLKQKNGLHQCNNENVIVNKYHNVIKGERFSIWMQNWNIYIYKSTHQIWNINRIETLNTNKCTKFS